MSVSLFQPAMLGRPLTRTTGRRLAQRRAWLEDLPWDEPLPDDADAARWTWTQTTFSEYCAAASFAEITAALAAAGAPIDLIATTSDFVIDELVHVEVSARIAGALGGGLALEVDLDKLVRPATGTDPLLRAAELIVRTSCVGEALTVPLLDLGRDTADSVLVSEALLRIMRDEAAHAQLGGWFLDWADARLDDQARAHLGRVAGEAVRAFAPLLGGGCQHSGLGAIACDRYDPVFARAASERVARPLAERGIEIPDADLRAVGACA